MKSKRRIHPLYFSILTQKEKNKMTLQNKNVVITGTLKKFERAKAYELISLNGGTPKDNMSNIVDILVVTDEKRNCYTNKMKKAPETIQVISENSFYALLGV